MSEKTFFYYILVLHHTKFHSSTLKIERWRGVLEAVSVEIRNNISTGHLPAYVWKLNFETLCEAWLAHDSPKIVGDVQLYSSITLFETFHRSEHRIFTRAPVPLKKK